MTYCISPVREKVNCSVKRRTWLEFLVAEGLSEGANKTARINSEATPHTAVVPFYARTWHCSYCKNVHRAT